jgi:hypothetical protein
MAHAFIQLIDKDNNVIHVGFDELAELAWTKFRYKVSLAVEMSLPEPADRW